MLNRLSLLLAALLFASPVLADVTVQSPNNAIAVTVTTNGEGRVQYRVDRNGKPVVTDSQLGFLFTDQPQMLRNFEIVGSTGGDHDSTWQTPWGEDRTIRDHYRDVVVSLHEKTGLNRDFQLEIPRL